MPTVLDNPIMAVAKAAATADQGDRKYAELMELNYPVELLKEDHQFTASYPDLPGCVSFGNTPNEAISELEAVKSLWIRCQLKSGNTVPLPSSYEDRFSGKFVIRIPKVLHRALHTEAEQQDVSLNQYVNYILSNRHSNRNERSVDYSIIVERVLSGLRDAVSQKYRYSDHASLTERHFDLQTLPSDFDRIALLGSSRGTVMCTAEISSTMNKKNYREAHIVY